MTGLDPEAETLIEIAVIVTDADLNPLDEGIDIIVHADDEHLDNMVPVVSTMHAESGLTDAVRASTVTLSEADIAVTDYVKQFVPDANTAPLCGNSIATDRLFIRKYLPRLEAHLHYRMIDVSSVKELTRRWYPRVYQNQPGKGMAHRALADIRESIDEMTYYREAVFVPHPGPNSTQAAEIAAQVSARNWDASSDEVSEKEATSD